MKGFTLIEALIVMAILVILVGISSTSLVSFGRNTNLDNGKTVVNQALQLTRSNSMANLSDSQWGVHLDTDKIVIFNGSAYNPNDLQNQVKLLPNNATLSWNINGGGQEILFDKNKSTTANFGSLTLSTSTNQNITINLNSEGMID